MRLPSGLAPEVYPLAAYIGRWRGRGTVEYPGISPAVIVQEITIADDGGPYLAHTVKTWVEGEGGRRGPHWHAEAGFWRVTPGQTDPGGGPRTAPPFEVELFAADPAGHATVYLGTVDGPRILLASDVVVRTERAAEVTAGRRMYGLVEGDLLWAWDIAAFGHELQTYMASRLSRVDADE